MKPGTLLPTALSLAISTCLLAACGGGGGAMVRAEAPPPPPPAAPAGEPCPAPITGDCTVDVPSDATTTAKMTGGRQSDFALIKVGGNGLVLAGTSGEEQKYRFGGGTTVEAGWIDVNSNANLVSDVTVQESAALNLHGSLSGNLTNFESAYIYGEVTGDVANHEYAYLYGTVAGNFANEGTLEAGAYYEPEPVPARIDGNFSQTASGTLVVVVGINASTGRTMSGGFLTVGGRADIDGTVQLVQFFESGPDEYVALPDAPLRVKVLHADGGVFGTFAQVTAPYLLITGELGYSGNDVYYDVATLSAAQVMGSVTAQSVTVASAKHFDAALADATRRARATEIPYTATQRQFLTSAGMIQRLQDVEQAIRTFDSLSGHGYASAADNLLQQAALPQAELVARTANLQAGWKPGFWSTPTTMLSAGGAAFNGTRMGFDQRLDDHTLVGASFGWSEGTLRFDHVGGVARDQSPQWNLYWRHNRDDHSYLFGDLGYSHHQLDLTRQIDLGLASRTAGAQRNMEVVRAYLETGRDFRLGRSRLTPFGGLGYAALHGAGFGEQGSTGFELIAQPSTYQRVNAVAGVRLGTDWRGSHRWTRLNLTAGYSQSLYARDDAHAAFSGAPGVTFSLAGTPAQQQAAWMQMSLATGGNDWNWLLSYDRFGTDQAMSLGATYQF